MTSREALWLLASRVQVGAYKEEMQNCFDIVNATIDKLEKRETPKKVIKEVDKKYIDTHDFYERDIYRCNNCKKVLLVDRYQKIQDNEKTNYCYYCGQKLDWSE